MSNVSSCSAVFPLATSSHLLKCAFNRRTVITFTSWFNRPSQADYKGNDRKEQLEVTDAKSAAWRL